MGSYTGLRFKDTIKSQCREQLAQALNNAELEWQAIENTPFTKEWAEYSRSDFIPWGEVCYMPRNDLWEYTNQYDVETGIWEVCCSLKNYDRTIEYFLTNVLSNIICAQEYVESLYEERFEPTVHKLINEENEQCK